MVCKQHLYLAPKHFHHPPKRNPVTLTITPIPFPQPLTITNVLSVSMDLPVLDVSYTWNHTVHALMWLASLSIMFPRFIHIVEYISTSFLLRMFLHFKNTALKYYLFYLLLFILMPEFFGLPFKFCTWGYVSLSSPLFPSWWPQRWTDSGCSVNTCPGMPNSKSKKENPTTVFLYSHSQQF